jgi:hypothetical protein
LFTVFASIKNVVQNTLIIERDRVWCQVQRVPIGYADTAALREHPVLLIMAARGMLCRRSREQPSAVLDLAGERDQRSSQSEMFVATQFGDRLNAKDVGEYLVVTLRQTRQSRAERRGSPSDSCPQRLVQHTAQLE